MKANATAARHETGTIVPVVSNSMWPKDLSERRNVPKRNGSPANQNYSSGSGLTPLFSVKALVAAAFCLSRPGREGWRLSMEATRA